LKLAVSQTQALLLASTQVQVGIDCHDDFRGKSSQIFHFSEIIAEIGIGKW